LIIFNDYRFETADGAVDLKGESKSINLT